MKILEIYIAIVSQHDMFLPLLQNFRGIMQEYHILSLLGAFWDLVVVIRAVRVEGE